MKSELISTRQIMLFGGHGQLGSALLRLLPSAQVRSVAWSQIHGFSDEELVHFFAQVNSRGVDFVFANGVTDPRLTREQIQSSNVEFPLRVIRATGGELLSSLHRYLTFGTIQERFPDVCRSNLYLQSKLDLCERVHDFEADARFLHFRIHTLYGGAPKAHMFLGQMASAIRENRLFEMSSGDQLREYHHVDDVAASVASVLGRAWPLDQKTQERGVVELNSGRPITLASLARGVFQAFGAQASLKIGALQRHQAENTQTVFEASPDWLLGASREPLSGVIESLKAFLNTPA